MRRWRCSFNHRDRRIHAVKVQCDLIMLIMVTHQILTWLGLFTLAMCYHCLWLTIYYMLQIVPCRLGMETKSSLYKLKLWIFDNNQFYLIGYCLQYNWMTNIYFISLAFFLLFMKSRHNSSIGIAQQLLILCMLPNPSQETSFEKVYNVSWKILFHITVINVLWRLPHTGQESKTLQQHPSDIHQSTK